MSDGVYSTGRGGVGNMRKGKPDTLNEQLGPSDSPGVPELKQKVFTTGRGGAGNMYENTDPQATRQAQDVGSLTPVVSPSLGRGGYGNVRAGQKAQLSLFEKARNIFKNEK